MRKASPFLATLVWLFVAEIGDKTQIATNHRARHEGAVHSHGHRRPRWGWCSMLVQRLPIRAIRLSVAAPFAAIGAAMLLRATLS